MNYSRKPILEKVKASESYSFNIEKISLPYFISKWHYHPEIELILFTNANGTGFIGNGLTSFSPGTFAMIGPYIPHVWLCYEEYYQGNEDLRAEAVVVKFNESFLGPHFINIPGVSRIKNLLEKSRQGIVFKNQLVGVKKDFVNLPNEDDFDKILKLLEILNNLSKTTEIETISTTTDFTTKQGKEHDRLDIVIKYVSAHFKTKIRVEEVANLVHLTPASFCRFFKSRTLKSFIKFVNEVRIEYSCKLLLENKLHANEIAYMSGFNQLSNFYKQFYYFKRMSPIAYRNKYWNRKLYL